ncbi:trypsin-like peptidase domain-containing protein [Streptomyces tibetensis]|uniref:trypsin-like peptidase domain-containing protein n=1 Tax=Streptomyces tibetensis TaxID=2382123 RepID=UPI0033E87766
MTGRFERVAQVVGTGDDSQPRLMGSGFLLVGDLAITAAHAVRDGTRRYEVRTVASARRAVVRTVVPHPGRDLALLVLDAERDSLPPVRFAELPRDIGQIAVHAVGFPQFTLEEAQPRSHQMNGTIQLGSDRTAHQIQMAVGTSDPWPSTTGGSPWSGYSGAGILTVSEGLLAGVVTSHRPTGDRRVLTGTGLGDLRDPEFLRVLAEHDVEASPFPARQVTAPATSPPHWLPPDVGAVLDRQREEADELPYRFRQDRRPRRLTAVYVRQVLSRPEEREAEGAVGRESAETGPGTSRTREAGPRQRLEDVLAEVLGGGAGGHLLVEAGPGVGKSTLLNSCALDMGGAVRTAPSASGALVPLMVTASRLAETGHSLESAVARATGLDTGDGTLPRLPPGARWLILVDALDEVHHDQRGRFIHRLADHAASDAPGALCMLVTTRPDPEATEELKKAGFPTYRLDPFSRPRLEEFARTWFTDSGHPELAEDFLRQLDEGGLSDLLRNPLLATVTAIVFENAPGTPLPDHRWGLYEQFRMQLLTAKRDRAEEAWRRLMARAGGVPRARGAVGWLREHLEELVLHLAHARVADGAQDLLWTALRWWDEHGTDEQGRRFGAVPPLDGWPNAVMDALLATGLLVREGSGVEFLHTTFAEHLAAEVLAAGLPEAFDLQDESWRTSLLAASGHTGHPLSDLHRDALVHYCHRHRAGGGRLLEWLLTDAHGSQELAGALLAGRCPADDTHYQRFLEIVEARSGPAVWKMLSGIRHPAVEAYLHDRAFRAGATYQVEAATALMAHRPADAAQALVRISAAPNARMFDLRHAASALLGTHPEHEDEAATVFQAVLRHRRAEDYDRQQAAATLSELGDDHAAQAASILTGIAGDPLLDGSRRLSAAMALPRLGERHRPVAAQVIRDLVSDPLSPSYFRRRAADQLASLGSAYADEAAQVLQGIAADPDVDPLERTLSAMELTHFRPQQREYAARACRSIMDDVTLDAHHRAYAGRFLARLGGAYAEEARHRAQRILEARSSGRWARRAAQQIIDSTLKETPGDQRRAWQRILADRRTSPALRLHTATLMAESGSGAADEVACALYSVLVDRYSSASERAGAAVALQKLGTSERETTVRRIRSRLMDTRTARKDRLIAARALLELQVPVPVSDPALWQDLVADREVEPGDAEKALKALRGTRGGQVGETAAALRRRLSDPRLDAEQREQVAQRLHSLGEPWLDLIVTGLRADLKRPDRDSRHRLNAARALLALGGSHVPTDPAVLFALATDRRTSGRERLLAARALLCVDGQRAEEVARVVCTIATRRSSGEMDWTTSGNRSLAEDILVDLGEPYADDSARAVRRAAGRPWTRARDRIAMAGLLTALGETHEPAAARILKGLIRRRSTSRRDRVRAAGELAGLGGPYTDEAVEIFRAFAHGRLVVARDRRDLARFMATVGGRHRTSAADVLAGLITSPWTTAEDRGRDVKDLVDLGAEFRPKAMRLLRAVIDGDGYGPEAKQGAEQLLASLTSDTRVSSV